MSSDQKEEFQEATTVDSNYPQYSDEQQFHNLVPEPFQIPEQAGVANETTLGVNQRLVPDLMKVYENMSVRKTPQTRSASHTLHEAEVAAIAAAGEKSAHKPPIMEDCPVIDSTTMPSLQWNHGNITIPPPFPVPFDTTTGHAGLQVAGKEQPSPLHVDSSSSADQPVSARKRSKESGSVSSTKRRKKSSKDKKNDDERWKKRFTWPDELHRDFVSAIFDIGLKHATPSSVLEQMPPLEQITTERIKSHLQKYRLHRRKSKEEFMSCYEETVERLKVKGGGVMTSLSGGQAAGYVSHAVENELDPELPTTTEDAGKTEETNSPAAGNVEQQIQDGNTILTIPRLTEEEKQSPLGTSLGYLLGLFFSLKRQLQQQRQSTANIGVEALSNSVTITQGSTSRSNLEAGSLMKREMESQMKFQNKMRALKQEELSKLAEIPSGGDGATKQPIFQDTSSVMNHQRPGESAEPHPSTKNRSASEDEEFWNSPAFDGELFDFLME